MAVTGHFNNKKIRLELNGKIKDFPSAVSCIEYLEDTYGIGSRMVKHIIKSNELYKPRQHALKVLTGLKLYYI